MFYPVAGGNEGYTFFVVESRVSRLGTCNFHCPSEVDIDYLIRLQMASR
jgi:hypothetical protein